MLFLCFWHENKISVDADLIGEIFVLTRCNPFLHDGKMNPARFSVAFARFILRIVEVIATRPRLARASVWCDLALPLSVMIMRTERGEAISNPFMRAFRLVLLSLCRIFTKTIMICCTSHCLSFQTVICHHIVFACG